MRKANGRRRWIVALSCASLLCVFAPAASGGEAGTRVLRVSLPVPELAAAASFLVNALGFRSAGQPRAWFGPEFAGLTGLPNARARSQRLQVGREQIELVAFDEPQGRAIPADSRSQDMWFQHLALVTSAIDRAAGRAQQAGARPISRGPQQIPASNQAAAGIRAYYFRGPAEHPLELIWFPPDKGQQRWHAPKPDVLGIDHTAIAVADTERSLRFYRDALGLPVVGESFNFGPEQEALSGVPGARVRITGLRGASGPGIELLQYVSPRDGRPTPNDSRASDAWRNEITLAVSDLDHTLAKLRAAGGRVVSDRVRALPDLGVTAGALNRAIDVLDPDGHALRLVQ